MICDECDKSVYGETKKRDRYSQTYYHCNTSRNNCSQKYLRDTEIERQLLDEIETIQLPDQFRELIIENIELLYKEDKEDSKVIVKNLQREYDSITRQLDKIVDLNIKELVSDDEFIIKRSSLQTQQLDIQNQIKKAKQAY